MSDWIKISDQEFEQFIKGNDPIEELVGRIVLDRLPVTFESKEQYFRWRHALAGGFEVDARDVVLIGSAATGRSLNARKKFKVFNRESDVDIAVISSRHFDQAWAWFRRANPNTIPNLDDAGRKLFDQHRAQYVFDGVIAANYFLSNLPFGYQWNLELQCSEAHLPEILKGRKMSVRIYRDNEALRLAQKAALASYRSYLENCAEVD